MKTIKTTSLIFAVLLLVSTAAAQNVSYAPPTPASFDSDGRVPLSVPKNSGANLSFTIGATWLNTNARHVVTDPFGSIFAPDSHSSGLTSGVLSPEVPAVLSMPVRWRGNMNLFGVTAAFGWRINKCNKIQIEASVLACSKSHDSSINFTDEVGRNYHFEHKHNIDYIVSMQTFVYNFIIPFDRKGVFELRLSPAIGLAYMHTQIDGSSNAAVGSTHFIANKKASDSVITYVTGAGIGATLHTSKRFQLDLGYRFMRLGKTSHNWGQLGTLNTNSLTLSAGWKF